MEGEGTTDFFERVDLMERVDLFRAVRSSSSVSAVVVIVGLREREREGFFDAVDFVLVTVIGSSSSPAAPRVRPSSSSSVTVCGFLLRDDAFLETERLMDFARDDLGFFAFCSTSSSASTSASSSSIGVMVFLVDLEVCLPPVAVDLAGGARGTTVSSIISGMMDLLRPRVMVEVWDEEGGLDDARVDFVAVEEDNVFVKGPIKNGQSGLRCRCSSLLMCH
jgi:hypothetical protein